MIRLAFCDDEKSVLDVLDGLFKQYAVEHDLKLECVSFCSSLELLAQIERGARFDVLFLDILMPGETGIRAAAEIRKYDSNVKIIFLTSSAEFAVESYTVGAYFYQMKPICRERLFSLLDSVIASCEKEQSSSIILRCKNGITRVDLNHLEYCEVIHRTLFIHLTNGKVLECTGSLDDLGKQLDCYGGFYRTHRSYLVNLEHIEHLSYKAVIMACGTEIPIPRGKYQEIKEKYLEHAFLNRRVMV